MSDLRTDSGQGPIASAIALAPGLAAAVLFGALGSLGVAEFAAWSSAGPLSLAQSAMYGAMSVGVGAAIALSLLWPASSRTSRKLGLMVLASSSTRMMVSLMVGLILFFVAKPQPYVFFIALGAAFLLCLTVESFWATAALRRAAARSLNKPTRTGVSV